jgi:putative MATE family efflux protein
VKPGGRRSLLDREILRLALPALGALVAEPLFLLVDTALVGRLGATSLAGLAIAATVLQTAVGLLVFLAYATTPAVARRLGAGDRPGAVRAGIDGLWLAAAISVPLVVLAVPLSGPVVALFGAEAAVTAEATVYLQVSVWGLPGMLLVLAATGLLRGLQDTRTPLVVAVAGFTANAVLNVLFMYGLGLGIAGSALGTVAAQWGMAAVYLVIAYRAARTSGISLRPGLTGVRGAAAAGGWLLLRTASLRVAMVATIGVGTSIGAIELAALHIALTLFATLAFVLDALAIAGQAMIGHDLGADSIPRVRAVTRRLVQLGVASGAVLGAAVVALSPVLGPLFTPDPEVHAALFPALLVLALGIPLAGFVFVLDGVLIGAGDAKYLAWTGLVNLAMYAPMLLVVATADLPPATQLCWVQVAFSLGYLGARALTLGLRVRTDRWLRAGATAGPAGQLLA